MASWRWRSYFRVRLLGAALALGAVACGAGDGVPPTVPRVLEVWNRSQFELEALIVTETPDYMFRTNQLAAPMAVDDVVTLDAFLSPSYVTVIRDQVQGGPAFALTTATRVSALDDGYMLVVFDQSFRLLSPEDLAAGEGP